MSKFLMRVKFVLGRYSLLLERSPLLTNSVSAAVLSGLGDASCQIFWEGKEEYDRERTVRMMIWRLFLWAPAYTKWIQYLDRAVGKGSNLRIVRRKVLLDQFVLSPPVLCAFFGAMCFMEGEKHPFMAAKQRALGSNYWDGSLWAVLSVAWPFWITVQGLTFAVIPTRFRVVWISMCQILGNGYLSGINESYRDCTRVEAADEWRVEVGYPRNTPTLGLGPPLNPPQAQAQCPLIAP